jgi:excisionase family DNA binding protein
MPQPLKDSESENLSEVRPGRLTNRISVPEIACRLEIGRMAVYAMLEQGLLPGIRFGRRWIVTRHAFEQWEKTCGARTGLYPPTEVEVN